MMANVRRRWISCVMVTNESQSVAEHRVGTSGETVKLSGKGVPPVCANQSKKQGLEANQKLTGATSVPLLLTDEHRAHRRTEGDGLAGRFQLAGFGIEGEYDD